MDSEPTGDQQDTLDATEQVAAATPVADTTPGDIAAKDAEPEESEDWDAEMGLEQPSAPNNVELSPVAETSHVQVVASTTESQAEEDWDNEMGVETNEELKKQPEPLGSKEADVRTATKGTDADADEDWDIEMDLGKTGGAKVLPSPPPNASSAAWHSSMAAVTSGFTGTVTRLGNAAKSDVEESWDEFDLDFMSSEETPRVGGSLVPHTKVPANLVDWDDDEEEALNTIKAPPGQSLLPQAISSTPPKKAQPVVEDEDFEEDFSLPEDLSHLSLRPLKHRSSKANLDGWGDHTASSSTTYSSEASSLGFGPNESPSNSTSTYTGPETDDDEEALLDGLILPEGLFDAEKSNRHVHKMIEERKRVAASEIPAIVASPQEDEDFESGLVIDDDVDFSLSRVKHHRSSLSGGRSIKSLAMQGLPVPPSSTTSGSRPPSRAQSLTESPEMQRSPIQRSKSPLGRSWASVAKESPRSSGTISPNGFRSPPSTVIREFRSSFHTSSRPVVSPPPSSFAGTSQLSTTRDSVRRQTSNSKLQDRADSQFKGIVRKVSLPSIDVSATRTESSVRLTLKRPASGMDTTPPAQSTRVPTSPPGFQPSRFSKSSRAVSMHNPTSAAGLFSLSATASRIQQSPNLVPPTPPGTPSSNPAALRLTMSTSSSRMKTRPALSSVFPSATLSRPSSFAAAVKSPPNSARSLPGTTFSTPVTPSSAAKLHLPARTKPVLSRSSTLTSVTASIPYPPQAKILKRPKRLRAYGDGTELDGIEDLPTDRDRENKYRVAPKGYSSGGKVVRKDSSASRDNPESLNDPTDPGTKSVRRRRADLSSARASVSSSVTATPSLGRSTLSPAGSPKASGDNDKRRSIGSLPLKRRPMLIRNLNGPGVAKVVGEMRWNPRTLRWEGNDQVLRDFDNVISSSARPALITNLTASALGSPVSSSSGIPGARVVGNMLFDPIKMCWVSQLPPEEEEPDVFADMADDEDDDSWKESKGGTIRASSGLVTIRAPPSPRPNAPPGKVLIGRVSPTKGGAGVLVVVGDGDGAPSPSYSQSSHSRTQSEMESGSERGSRLLDQSDGNILLDQTNRAEKRHPEEMRGWIIDPEVVQDLTAPNTLSFPAYEGNVSHAEMDRSYLHELRAIATAGN